MRPENPFDALDDATLEALLVDDTARLEEIRAALETWAGILDYVRELPPIIGKAALQGLVVAAGLYQGPLAGLVVKVLAGELTRQVG